VVNIAASAQRLRAHSISSDRTAHNVMVSVSQPPRDTIGVVLGPIRIAPWTATVCPSTFPAPENDDAVVDSWLLYVLTNFDDDPRRIVTQDEGQSHTIVASILSYLSVQRAIDRDGVHLNEDFSWDRTRCRDLSPPEDLGGANSLMSMAFIYVSSPEISITMHPYIGGVDLIAVYGISASLACLSATSRPHQLERGQSCRVASTTPSAIAFILAQATSGYTRLPYPQSVPAMTFSRPMMLA
jgi:hypothetical protein